jgi:hypothetical protein
MVVSILLAFKTSSSVSTIGSLLLLAPFAADSIYGIHQAFFRGESGKECPGLEDGR